MKNTPKVDPRKQALRENLKRRKQLVKNIAKDPVSELLTRKSAIETKSATKGK